MAARDFEDLLQVINPSVFSHPITLILTCKCSIPAFEGLLDQPHNKRLLKLLYHAAEWHALAKLRMHTESSLALLETLTSDFGKLMVQFRDQTCTQFATCELPREAASRARRQADQIRKTRDNDPLIGQHPEATPPVQPPTSSPLIQVSSDGAAPETIPAAPAAGSTSSGKRKRALNLLTVKFHFLGDYVRHIRLFGTTDSYSTQLVSL